MANLIGMNPRPWVSNQVNLRQQLLGLQNQPSQVLAWQTSNVPWIRMISSVSVSEEKSKELTNSTAFSKGKLSQEFVLFNGTTKISNSKDENGNSTLDVLQKSGVLSQNYKTEEYSSYNNINYGFGGSPSRGLVPMPGIESVSIKDMGSNGSLRSASIKIKAFNRHQFAILDALFMRPGYTFLLEWGNSVYFKGTPENPIYSTANFNTKAFELMTKFLNGDANQFTKECLFQEILKERGDGTLAGNNRDVSKGSQGNYDAFYGKVNNFKWSLTKDGSYDIEVIAMSIGDIVESLKMNTSNNTSTSPPPKKSSSTSKPTCGSFTIKCKDDKGNFEITVPNEQKEQFKEYWEMDPTNYSIPFSEAEVLFKNVDSFNKKTLKRPEVPKKVSSSSEQTPPEEYQDIFHAWVYDKYNWLTSNFPQKSTPIPVSNKTNANKINVLNTFGENQETSEYDDLLMIGGLNLRTKKSNKSYYQYVKLRKLLKFIEQELLLYDGGELNDANDKPKIKSPIIRINTSGANFCYTQPTQLSSNPLKTIIPFNDNFNISPTNETPPETITYFKEVIGDDFSTSSDYVGSLMNLPVNIHFALEVYKSVSKEGSVTLLSYLEELFLQLQESLGNINKFSVRYNHDSNEIIIQDKVSLDPTVATQTATLPESKRTFFNINGWKPLQQNGSFVEGVSISSTLSKEFQAMTTISSGGDTSSDSENTTGLTRFNRGLLDSVSPTKLSSKQIELTKKDIEEKNTQLTNAITNLKAGIISSFYSTGNTPSTTLLDSSKALNSAIQTNIAKLFNKFGFTPPPQGFIPFNMGLDMKGFSGLRINEKFYISTEILPSSYPDALDFICTGNEHSISKKGWTTKTKAMTMSGLDENKGFSSYNPRPTTPENSINIDVFR